MLKSKDFVIKVFKKEIERKNQLIGELIERQDELEQKLSTIEQCLTMGEVAPRGKNPGVSQSFQVFP